MHLLQSPLLAWRRSLWVCRFHWRGSVCDNQGASQTTTFVYNRKRNEEADVLTHIVSKGATDSVPLYQHPINCKYWITTSSWFIICIRGWLSDEGLLTFGLLQSHRQHPDLRTGPSQDQTWRSCLEEGQSLQWAPPHWWRGTAGRSAQTVTAPFPISPELTVSGTSPSL